MVAAKETTDERTRIADYHAVYHKAEMRSSYIIQEKGGLAVYRHRNGALVDVWEQATSLQDAYAVAVGWLNPT